jgi:ribonucleoside-diphosphate reductase alpha subunit
MNHEDSVTKRNGDKEVISFDKILNRIKKLGVEDSDELNVNYTDLSKKIIDRLYDGISTTLIDELTAQQCASLATTHPDYGILASRIMISNHHKNTSNNFLFVCKQLHEFKDIHGENHPIISNEHMTIIEKYSEQLENMIDYKRDYLIDYFGFKTLERAYLLRVDTVIVERPQHMWLRVAIAIHKENIEKVKETYDLMSQKYFTHATPTLFNAGTPRPQLSSCYLIAMEKDSIQGIYNTLTDCAKISKWAGGIGMHIHNVRASGSHIRGTNGTSNGIVPMLRVFNNTARYVDQCVLPETYIYTTEGPIQIQHCVAGDTQIFTTDGYETINNVLEHSYSGDILHINSVHSFKPLTITPEHPVYCLKNQEKGLNYSLIKNRINRQIIKPEWVEAGDLTTKDMLIFTKPKYEKDNTSLSQDDCYMYGLLLGDGCMNNSSTSCYISLHSTNKQDNLTFVKDYLSEKYIPYFIDTEHNTSRIRWNKSIELPFRYATLYDENKEKFIHSSWLNLPVEKIKYIVKGLIDSDGCITKEIVFDTTSLKLVESLRYLLLRMGIPTGGYIRDRIGEKHVTIYGDIIENKKISYCLRIPKTKEIGELFSIEKGQFHKFFEYDNLIYTRISDIEKGTYEGTLYDLQLTKTHNYLIHNGVIHNGGGKRSGSFAIYLEPWHGDIESFLEMKKNHGDEEMRARDLFYALWIPDLFMERIEQNGDWTLMCPDKCPGLSDVYGEEFKELYEKYETEGKGNKTVKARDLWFKILDSQIETGTPYMLYKDACNKKSNQKNLGTIKSSNLCTEIIEYSDENETAVCNLASIALSKFITETTSPFTKSITIYTKTDCKWCDLLKALLKRKNIDYTQIVISLDNFEDFKQKHNVTTLPQLYHGEKLIGGYSSVLNILKNTFNYELLHKVTKVVTRNLNNVIDINFYPTDKTKKSNMRHRPIGIGIQGLADAFAMMDIPFYSEEAKLINKHIFETMYHGALESSWESACKDGHYETFKGSPTSEGILQFDMWNVTPSTRYDWDKLKLNIKKDGIRNSLLLAPMPTASTSQILGNNECFEPFTSNIYVRRTMAGEFVCINKFLLRELIELGLWTDDIKNSIIRQNGSVQGVSGIPKALQDKYKIVWEIPMKHILEMAADRGAFICQSQSTNLWMKEPTYNKLTAMHFFAWKKGLKTGIYYLRTKAKAAPQQFTIEPDKNNSVEEEEECLMCGS